MLGRFRALIVSFLICIILPLAVVGFLSKLHPESALVEPDEAQIHISESGKGTIPVLMPNGEISDIAIEEYVVRVVRAEMPASFDLEALKAQSVLARTYALKHADTMAKHTNAAVCTSSGCCQAFYDMDLGDDPDAQKVIKAVKATEGTVLKYKDELIEATYFSCSGGRTENAVDVWGEDVPYLVSTASNGEENSVHYISTSTYGKQEFLTKLGIETSDMIIANITYTDGGGIAQIQICDKIFTGIQVRKLLGLKSTAFHISSVGENVIITTKGYGHRVGMSQYGADAMAAEGYKYNEILAYYFPDTQLQKEMQ